MIEENSVSIGLRNIEYLIKIDLEERRILKSFLSNIHTRRDTNFIFEFFILNSILVKIWREIYPKFNIIDFIRIMSFQIKYSISKPIKQLLFNLLRL
jgi:hypothetical protein